jgi:hypothetical protein
MKPDASDLLLVLGALALVVAAGLISGPAGLAVLGLELVAVGLLLTHQANMRR